MGSHDPSHPVVGSYHSDIDEFGCREAVRGEVIIADDQEPPTLNPFIPGGDNTIVSIVGQAHMAGAYDVAAPSLELVPELVLEIPSSPGGGVVLNDDGSMSVRYRIRAEAVWSDGEPVVGADPALTLDFEQGAAFPSLTSPTASRSRRWGKRSSWSDRRRRP